MRSAETAAPKRRHAQRARPPRANHAYAHQNREDQGPQEVELLLDGQRPQVLEQRRTSYGLEVGLLAEDQVPVGDVPQGRQHVPTQPGHLPWQEHDRVGERDHEDDVEGGQQPPGASHPECLEVYAAPLAPLGEQQRGDEVAADDEEDLDAQESSRKKGGAAMVEEHGDNGQGAQPVQARHVGQVRSLTSRDGATASARGGHGAPACSPARGPAGRPMRRRVARFSSPRLSPRAAKDGARTLTTSSSPRGVVPRRSSRRSSGVLVDPFTVAPVPSDQTGQDEGVYLQAYRHTRSM